MMCWHFIFLGGKCRFFAYGLDNATLSPSFLSLSYSKLALFSGAGLPGCPGKEAIKRAFVCLKGNLSGIVEKDHLT